MLNKFADAHVWDSQDGFTVTMAKCHLVRFSASDPTRIGSEAVNYTYLNRFKA